LHIAAVSKLVCVIGLDYMCSACRDAVRIQVCTVSLSPTILVNKLFTVKCQ